MKPILNIVGVIGGATGVVATLLGIYWIYLYNTFKPLFVFFDPRYTQFPIVTLAFTALASATLILMGVSYMNLKRIPGITGAILGILGGCINIGVWLSNINIIQIPVLLILVSNILYTTIYLILYIPLAILAAMGIILVIKNKATISEFAIVGGALLSISAALTVFWIYGLLILLGGFPIVAYSLYEVEPILKQKRISKQRKT
nr:hypothetical protein [Candidatus Freyarchaeota archaeon]